MGRCYQIDGKGHTDVYKPSKEFLVPVAQLSCIWATRSLRKRFTGLCEAEAYQAAAAALGGASHWPRANRRPRRKARKSRRPHKNYRHRKPRLQLISPVLRCTVNLQVESSKVVRDTLFP